MLLQLEPLQSHRCKRGMTRVARASRIGRLLLAVLVTLVSIGGGAATAQTLPPATPESDPLRGPVVAPAGAPSTTKSGEDSKMGGPAAIAPVARRSLVRRDFNGTMAVLETRPEIAALDAMTLNPEETSATKTLFRRRFVFISRFLADHWDVFLALRGARQSGAGREGTKEMREKFWEFRKLADPLLRPLLAEQIAPLLTDENEFQFRAMVEEYVDAFATQEGNGRAAPGGEKARAQAPARVRERVETGLLLREIARTLASMVESGREKTESLMALIQPDTPEQEAEIRAAIRRMGEARGTSLTREDRAKLMAEIQSLLTPEQRERVRRGLREGNL